MKSRNSVVEALRRADPCPARKSAGWSRSPDGLAARARAVATGGLVDAAPLAPSRRRRLAAGLAVVLTVSAIVALFAVLRGPERPVAPRRPEGKRLTGKSFLAGTWRTLDPGPIKTEFAQHTVWTGREMIVWGSQASDSRLAVAAFNPRTNTWRHVAGVPLAAHDGAVTAWSGRELFVWGGIDGSVGARPVGGGSPPVGAVYRPATDSWEIVPRAPIESRSIPVITWAGREFLVIGGRHADGGPDYEAAAYDPVARRWRRLPDLPAPVDLDRSSTAVWDGTAAVVLGQVGISQTSGAALVAYHPSSDTWEVLPSPPFAGSDANLVRTGNQLVAVHWADNPLGYPFLEAATFDLASRAWTRLAPFALRSKCPVFSTVTPAGVVVNCAQTALLDAASGSWRTLPPYPQDHSPEARDFVLASVVWTGRELLLFRGDIDPWRQFLRFTP